MHDCGYRGEIFMSVRAAQSGAADVFREQVRRLIHGRFMSSSLHLMLTLLKVAFLTLTELWQPPPLAEQCRTQLWNVQPIDPSNNITGGWPEISSDFITRVWAGSDFNRTYAHHPIIKHFDNTTILLWSSAAVDEDSLGQRVMSSTSHDRGMTWSYPAIAIPGALLPNQTTEGNFSQWCSEEVIQRAWQSEAVVQSPGTGHVYAVADSTCFACLGGGWQHWAAGRVARRLDLASGSPMGSPCWLSRNRYTDLVGLSNTTFGLYPYCEEVDTLNVELAKPEQVPAWSAALYNHDYIGSVEGQAMEEPTHAVLEDGKIWRRFWRDRSPTNNTWSVWTECTKHPERWFPNDLPLRGDTGLSYALHDIYQTDIPDAETKQFFGIIQPRGIRYLISNPRTHATNLTRYPLTIAWQDVGEHNWSFKNIAVLRTRPDPIIAPETRDQYKNPGFSYPSAVQVGDKLLVAYSENKENIWVSSVPISTFERGSGRRGT